MFDRGNIDSTKLQEMIQRAQSRIFISSLYIGSAESELVRQRFLRLDPLSLRL